MTWVRIDDAFADHPKIVQAGSRAGWLDVAGMCYASRFLTDGFVPAKQIHKLTDEANPDELAQALVDAGLWEPRPGGFQIHDYLDYNPSATQVREQRRLETERKGRWRAGTCPTRSPGGTDGGTDGGTPPGVPPGLRPESERNPDTPVPIPGQIEGKGEEDLELDAETAAKASAFQSAASRPASTRELAQLAQLDATPAEIGKAVQIAADRKARNLLPYARTVLADWQTSQQATQQARRQQQPAPRPTPATDDPAATLWKATQAELLLQMTQATWDTYILTTTAGERTDHALQIIARSEPQREWIDNRLRGTIERTLASIAGEELHLQVMTKESVPCAKT